MLNLSDIASSVVLAQESMGGGGEEAGGGSFLVQPGIGLMIWTLIAFGITMLVLKRLAFPRISAALEERAQKVAKNIEESERQRKEADEVLAEYRERLKQAREQGRRHRCPRQAHR